MNKLHCDFKNMYRSRTGHEFILVVTDEVTNYLVTIPLYRGSSHEIAEAVINYVFCKQGSPSYVSCDEDQAFVSSFMQDIYKR